MSRAPKPQNRRVKAPSLPEPEASVPADAPIEATPKRPSSVLSALRQALGIAIVAGVAAGAAWGARRYVTRSPRFAVQEIVVTGPKTKTPEQIASEAGVAIGDNVFLLDLERAKRKLESDPWIARATLARRLPGTVGIDVEERQAAILVAAGDTWLATESGEIFKKLEPGDPSDLVVLTGLDPDTVANDREGAAKIVRRALDLAGDYQLSPLRAPLQEIHVGTSGVSIRIGAGLELVLGEPPFRRKLDEAARALAELDRRGAKASTLLLDAGPREGRVVARLR